MNKKKAKAKKKPEIKLTLFVIPAEADTFCRIGARIDGKDRVPTPVCRDVLAALIPDYRFSVKPREIKVTIRYAKKGARKK